MYFPPLARCCLPALTISIDLFAINCSTIDKLCLRMTSTCCGGGGGCSC